VNQTSIILSDVQRGVSPEKVASPVKQTFVWTLGVHKDGKTLGEKQHVALFTEEKVS